MQIDEGRTVALARNRHPLALPQYDKRLVPPDLRMDRMIVVLTPDPSQQASLDALLQSQQDPGSPLFRLWLTPQQFGASFGISDGDLDQVLRWLHGYRFQTEPVTPGRRSVVFSGTATQVQSAFHTQIHTYEVNVRRHYANASDPEIAEALAAVVAGVGPLHDFAPSAQSHKLGRRRISRLPMARRSRSGARRLASIYNVNSLYVNGIDGRGQSIAIVGRTNIDIANVRTFRRAFGLPSAASIRQGPRHMRGRLRGKAAWLVGFSGGHGAFRLGNQREATANRAAYRSAAAVLCNMLVERFDGGALHAARRFTVFRSGIEHDLDGLSHQKVLEPLAGLCCANALIDRGQIARPCALLLMQLRRD